MAALKYDTSVGQALGMVGPLVKDLSITRPEQVWVSDITYIRTDEGFCYLNMITDAWSRKIVGYAIGGGAWMWNL